MPNIFDQAEKELNNFIQKDILSYSKNRNYDYGPEEDQMFLYYQNT